MCSLLKKNEEISAPISDMENQSSGDPRNEVTPVVNNPIICNPEEKFSDLDEGRSCNKYFHKHRIPEHLKMDYVALHVKGNTDHRVERCMWDHDGMVSWGEFSDEICRRFSLPIIRVEEEEDEEEEEDFKLCKHVHGVEKHNEAIEDLKEQNKEIEEEGDEHEQVDMSINTLKLLGKVNKKPIVILIDTGSTHSFLNPRIVQDMGLKCAQTAPIQVAVANGDELICDVVCPKFKWTVQGEPFEKDIMLLKMSVCMGDMVLGMDWLDEFAPVQLDTKPLSISFQKGSRWITLYGILPGEVLKKLN